MENQYIYKLEVDYIVTNELRTHALSNPSMIAHAPYVYYFKSIKAVHQSLVVYKEVFIKLLFVKYPTIEIIETKIHYKQICRSLQSKNNFVRELKFYQPIESSEPIESDKPIKVSSNQKVKEQLPSKKMTKKQIEEEELLSIINRVTINWGKRTPTIHLLQVKITKEILFSKSITQEEYLNYKLPDPFE